MRCRTQFPPEFVVPVDLLNRLLATGWRDESWGNNVCPSFVHDEQHLLLWVDAERPADRELPQHSRFLLLRVTSEGWERELYRGDDEAALLARLAYLSTNV